MKNKEYNQLVLEFRLESCPRKRKNEILLIIEGKWAHLMLKRVSTLPEKDHEDFWQIYRMRILKAINDWKGSAMFTTYLCRCVIGTLREYLWTNHKDQFKAKQLIIYSNFDQHEDHHGVRGCLHDASWGTFEHQDEGNPKSPVIGMIYQTSNTFGINGIHNEESN